MTLLVARIANSYFVLFEIFGDAILSNLPFYFEVKIALLIWLIAPKFNGADKVSFFRLITRLIFFYSSDLQTSDTSLLGALRSRH